MFENLEQIQEEHRKGMQEANKQFAFALEANNIKCMHWLASFPKSGNTWVRMFLDSFIAQRPLEINNVHQHWVQGDLSPIHMQAVCPRPITSIPTYFQVHLRAAALLHAATFTPAPRVCFKTHHANITIDGVPLIPPRLTRSAVYLVRDPRDVVLSWAVHNGSSIEHAVEQICRESALVSKGHRLTHVLRAWSDHVESWLMERNFPVCWIRYEDLLANPEECFKMILQVYELENEETMKDESFERRFQFAMEQSSMDNLKELEDKEGFKEKRQGDRFFRHGQAGRWLHELSRAQVRKIEEHLADVMVPLGYDLAETKLEDVIGEVTDEDLENFKQKEIHATLDRGPAIPIADPGEVADWTGSRRHDENAEDHAPEPVPAEEL